MSLRIMFHLHQRMLLQHATGWNGSWNMKVFVKGKEKCVAGRRSFAPVLDKYQMDPIWIIWEVIFKECENKDDKLTTKIVRHLLKYLESSTRVACRKDVDLLFISP